MTVTDDFVNEIRSLLADNVDEDGENSLFSDKWIADVAGKADSLNHALYILYTQKAGKVITEEGRIKAIKAGNEVVEKLSCIEMSKACLEMAENYRKMWLEEKRTRTSSSQFIY